MDTSIVLGVKKIIPSVSYPQTSIQNKSFKSNKEPFKLPLWGDIDFHNSGKLGNTYVITIKIDKKRFSKISFNLLVDNANLYLESFTLQRGPSFEAVIAPQ